jgi:two-component system chemotaxis sensor kinase CheA
MTQFKSLAVSLLLLSLSQPSFGQSGGGAGGGGGGSSGGSTGGTSGAPGSGPGSSVGSSPANTGSSPSPNQVQSNPATSTVPQAGGPVSPGVRSDTSAPGLVPNSVNPPVGSRSSNSPYPAVRTPASTIPDGKGNSVRQPTSPNVRTETPGLSAGGSSRRTGDQADAMTLCQTSWDTGTHITKQRWAQLCRASIANGKSTTTADRRAAR